MFSGEEIFINLAVALALGLIIGFERGWRMRDEEEGSRFAGIRTFMLISFLGALTAMMEIVGLRALTVVIATAMGAVIVAVVLRHRSSTEQGITTVVAAILAYVLGILAGIGLIEIAALSAVVVTVILGVKSQMHGWFRLIERRELDAALKLLVISVLILPLLPNEGYGPWDALNPYTIWWMVVLIAVISFIGHFAIKWSRPEHGLMVTALAGGLASSTAIAVSFARLARDAPDLSRLLAAGVVASSTVAGPRAYIIAVAVAPQLAAHLALILGPATVAGAIVSWLLWRGQDMRAIDLSDIRTDFDLGTALRFGFVLALIMLAAAGMRELLGDEALYGVAAVGGLVDVTAMTLTAAQEFRGGISLAVATGAILIALAVNTASKAVIVRYLGGGSMTGWTLIGFAALIVTAAIAYFVVAAVMP